MGKTALLDRIELEVVNRQGVVARLDGRDPAGALASLTSTHQTLLADLPDGPAPRQDPPSTVGAAYRAAIETAATAQRPLVVLVDELHVASSLTDELGSVHSMSAHDHPSVLVFAGVHNHALMSSMPGGIRSLELGYLKPAAAMEAIAVPLADNDIDIDPGLVDGRRGAVWWPPAGRAGLGR